MLKTNMLKHLKNIHGIKYQECTIFDSLRSTNNGRVISYIKTLMLDK